MNFDSPTYLVDLIVALTQAQIRFIVAGGVAVVLHGVERMTLDLDIALADDHENIERFLRFVASNGLVPRAPIPAATLLDPVALTKLVQEKGALVLTFWDPNHPWVQIDVFLKQEASYSILKINSVSVVLREPGATVEIASVERIIQMKRSVQPPRDKDLADIAALEKLRKQ